MLTEYYIPILCKQYNLIFNIESSKHDVQYAILHIMCLALAGMNSMVKIIWTLFEHKTDNYICVKS